MAVRDWFTYKPKTYKIKIDDNEAFDIRALIIVCGNANQWGNECHVTPEAQLADGLLNLTIVHPIRLYNLPRMLFQIFGYSFHKNKHVTTFTGRHITISSNDPMEVQYDGEAIVDGNEVHKIDIDIELGALNIVSI